MALDTLSSTSLHDQHQKVLSSLQKLNNVAVADVQKLMQHRMASLQAYSDMYVTNLKAAAEVRDLKGLQSFLGSQGELTRKALEEMARDAKEVMAMNVGFMLQLFVHKHGNNHLPL